MDSLNRICSATEDSDKVFVELYKEMFPKVAKYISRRGGTFDQARDIFQDALIIYYEQALSAKQVIKQTKKVYIFGIAKHLWLHQFKLGYNYEPLNGNLEIVKMVDQEQISDERLMQLLASAGEKCMQLLKRFYYDKFSMIKIAEQFGFTSERSATVQKFKCLEKVRGYIKEKVLRYEDFIE